jgi:hypothetical protein
MVGATHVVGVSKFSTVVEHVQMVELRTRSRLSIADDLHRRRNDLPLASDFTVELRFRRTSP